MRQIKERLLPKTYFAMFSPQAVAILGNCSMANAVRRSEESTGTDDRRVVL
jgi:hypothetical protein